MNLESNYDIQYVSYWENAPGQSMPVWVALALVSMRKALGSRFTLLTPHTVAAKIGANILEKQWAFEPLAFTLADGIEAIIAKSDFIRMAYIHRWGGVWLDADTLLFRDPTEILFPTPLSQKLHWHSECLFGSKPGNTLLADALMTGLANTSHAWGNPGRIKDIVAQDQDAIVAIADEVIDPGYRPRYNFAGCDVMRRKNVDVIDFLRKNVAILKLYNTYFRRTATTTQTVAEFLADGTLMAKLFLHIEAEPEFWVEECERLVAEMP